MASRDFLPSLHFFLTPHPSQSVSRPYSCHLPRYRRAITAPRSSAPSPLLNLFEKISPIPRPREESPGITGAVQIPREKIGRARDNSLPGTRHPRFIMNVPASALDKSAGKLVAATPSRIASFLGMIQPPPPLAATKRQPGIGRVLI